MNNKYFIYALFVTLIATATSWSKMFGSTSSRGGSSWTSHSGGYTGGGGYSGGGHK